MGMNELVLSMPIANVMGRECEPDGLVAQAMQGDSKAFEALYRHHVGRIYALCLRLAGSRTVAEDCTQDAFVQAWKALPGFRGDSAFGSWLHRIAVNTVLARHRGAIRRSAWLHEGDDALDSVAAPNIRPDAAIDLDRAIAELPCGAREVFVLFAVEGYKHEEIAALTGLAVGTTKAHLHRARRLLRARLT